MKIINIIIEDFVNYKKPSIFIGFPTCTFKCNKDAGKIVCQNYQLIKEKQIDISYEEIVKLYLDNPLTSAIVFGGLEPFDSYEDMINLITEFRKYTYDDIVIYTGYTEYELTLDDSGRQEVATYNWLKHYPNIYIKFGRFVPDQKSHYDEVLGVMLASDNQYGKKVSYEGI